MFDLSLWGVVNVCACIILLFALKFFFTRRCRRKDSGSTSASQHADLPPFRDQSSAQLSSNKENFLEQFTLGQNFVKFGRRGKPHTRCIVYDEKQQCIDWKTNKMKIKDIFGVVDGPKTSVFHRALKENHLDASEKSLCFSIISRKRSLDLKAGSLAQKKAWLAGITDLMTQLEKGNRISLTSKTNAHGHREIIDLSLPQNEMEKRALPILKKQLRDRSDCETFMSRIMKHSAPHESEDELLLRFLRARNCKPNEAVKMLNDDIEWRDDNKVASLQTATASSVLGGLDPEILMDIFPHGLLGTDYQGRPVIYKQYGQFLVKKLKKKYKLSIKQLVRYDMWLTERSIRLLHANVQSFVVIIDLLGIGWANMSPTQLKYCRGLADAGAPHYPERLGHMIILNSPKIFVWAFNLINSWLDARTQAKIRLLAGEDQYLPEVEAIMSKDMLPTRLGGKVRLEGYKSMAHDYVPIMQKGEEQKTQIGE